MSDTGSDAYCDGCRESKHCNEFGPDCGYYCACACTNGWMRSYRNYSYHGLLDNPLAHFIWRKLFCRIRWHLWDEVLSSSSNDPQRRHYLFCDACNETVDIAPGEEFA